MEPWYKVVTPREEVREGRSFNPDEFAIALEQVVAETAPEDYSNPAKFFSRTCFTRNLKDYTGMVLRRLAGQTVDTAPVLSLITQFGGGKTHTLTTLYHILNNPDLAMKYMGVVELLGEAKLKSIPEAKVAVFVGNAWDPAFKGDNPWLDLARQLAGEEGVAALGPSAQEAPPGTESITRLFQVAGGRVLILMDEVLNFINRHQRMADHFYAFLQNLTVATSGTSRCAAMISLPRSQVEMTDQDLVWQEKINKIVRRKAKDLISNDEAEIAEVICRRLFEDLGKNSIRKKVAKTYAKWCFEHRAELPSEWTSVDTATTDNRAISLLEQRFEACYPFHPATLSVFQRKWQSLSQYQQTRGTLAMLAQWISWAYREGYKDARNEALITLGSAPLEISEFRSVILGQLGETRLLTAIQTDLAGPQAHSRVLDADTKNSLKNIHRRVGTTILFESSGGQADKVAHLPELRFALGEPKIDTTSIDMAASALEKKAYYLRAVGSDGYKIKYKPTLKKVVNDRRASLSEGDIHHGITYLIREEFERGSRFPLCFFPEDGAAIPDSPKLTIAIMGIEHEWGDDGKLRNKIKEWMTHRADSPRLFPGSLIFCLKKPGRQIRQRVEDWLAWRKVDDEISKGTLGGEFEQSELRKIKSDVKSAEEYVRDEVWASYRYFVIYDPQEPDGLAVKDLGAGHASKSEPLSERVINALKTYGYLNMSVGASYIERHWPPALVESGAWPITSLRQSFLNGSLTRLPDPENILRNKVVEFVSNGDFGYSTGKMKDGTYNRIWFNESLSPDEISFNKEEYLLIKTQAKALKLIICEGEEPTGEGPTPPVGPIRLEDEPEDDQTKVGSSASSQVLELMGMLPPEIWNKFGVKIIPKLKQGSKLHLGLTASVEVESQLVRSLQSEIRQVLQDLGLEDKISIGVSENNQ